jgi:hypothetical protein
MERRRTKPVESLDFPRPWEDRQITKAQWEKHRELLMSGCGSGHGSRPDGWWLYERNRQPLPPYKQARVLYEMGELRGAELELCLGWWRRSYNAGLDLADIPPALIKQWRAQRRRSRLRVLDGVDRA